jgi:hypothetical protein
MVAERRSLEDDRRALATELDSTSLFVDRIGKASHHDLTNVGRPILRTCR